MGASVSVKNDIATTPSVPFKMISLKQLPDAIEDALYVSERFPLIIDPFEQASRFLKYQSDSFFIIDESMQVDVEKLNRSLVGAMQHGRKMTLMFSSLENLNGKLFNERLFPCEIISKFMFFNEIIWKNVIQSDLDDPSPEEFIISPEFVFIICTTTDFIPPQLATLMCVIKVDNDTTKTGVTNAEEDESTLEAIADLCGATEIKRNSIQLVEAAFDGDLDELKNWLEKGFHLESIDNRKHTSLSEAACQGHVHIVNYLLSIGADPNALNDTGRSPLWRASYQGHLTCVELLLNAGSNPEYRDKVSMESAFDVTQIPEIRTLLVS